jgi:hypothetical protein
MKRLIIISTVCVCVCGLLFFSNCGETIYALHSRDVEILFLVTDAATGDPIPGATVDLLLDLDDDPPEGKRMRLIADENGQVSYFRDQVRSEDIIKPFRSTRMTFDLGWAVYTVSAKGYSGIEDQWLHTSKFENLGRKNGRYRLQFGVPLHKATP